MTEISKKTEALARAWIACDPNRSGNEPGSGYHPDDIIGQSFSGGSGREPVGVDTPLTGKPRWHWFIPRAEYLERYLAERGWQVVPIEQ